MCINNYSNIERFDKVIAKIEWRSFFLLHTVVMSCIRRYILYHPTEIYKKHVLLVTSINTANKAAAWSRQVGIATEFA